MWSTTVEAHILRGVLLFTSSIHDVVEILKSTPVSICGGIRVQAILCSTNNVTVPRLEHTTHHSHLGLISYRTKMIVNPS